MQRYYVFKVHHPADVTELASRPMMDAEHVDGLAGSWYGVSVKVHDESGEEA